MVDDFDNPKRKWKPNYPYARDAVRKKSERKQLKGQSCDCCRGFWSKEEETLGKEEPQKMKDAVSKHRADFPRPTTPPGFWNPVFSSDSD